MNSDRIRQLENFLSETPDDPFLLYALALEYQELEPAKAMDLYNELLERHPDYLATYYHAAALNADMGKRENAEKIYRHGIRLAQEQKSSLALRELQNAYNQFLFGEED